MSRTIPRAYVTAAWSKNPVEAADQAKKYCSELVKAGYLPLCPVLAFSGIIAIFAVLLGWHTFPKGLYFIYYQKIKSNVKTVRDRFHRYSRFV